MNFQSLILVSLLCNVKANLVLPIHDNNTDNIYGSKNKDDED